MGEIRRTVARWHGREIEADFFQRSGFEGEHAIGGGNFRGLQAVPREIEERGGEVFGGDVALVEFAGVEDLGEQGGGERFAGFVVLGVVFKNLGPDRPHLVHLRGKFHEVARDAGAAEARIFHVGEHAVKGVAEFMEERRDFVEGEERGLAGGRLGNVEVVADDGLGAEEGGLRFVLVHPGATVFGRPRVGVENEERERGAVGVEDFKHADLGAVNGQIGAFLEGDAEEFRGGEKRAVDEHVVELEVRFHLRLVEGVAGGADFFRVKIPVAGGGGEAARFAGEFGVNDLLNVRGLFARVGDGGRGELGEEGFGGGDVFGGLVFEDVVGVRGVAEEGGALGAESGESGDVGAVIEFAAAAAAGERGAQDELAAGAIGERRERGLAAGVDEGEGELARVAGGFGELGGSGDFGFRETGERGAVIEINGGGGAFLQHVLGKRGLGGGDFGVEGFEFGFLGFGKPGAGADEGFVSFVEEAGGFGIEAQAGASFMQRADAGEERGVEENGVAVRGEFGGEGFLDGLEGGVGVAAVDVGKNPGDAAEELAGALEGDDGVVEGRGRGVSGDGGDLGEVLGHAAFVGGRVVLVFDFVELWIRQRQRAHGKERIGGGSGLGLDDGHEGEETNEGANEVRHKKSLRPKRGRRQGRENGAGIYFLAADLAGLGVGGVGA